MKLVQLKYFHEVYNLGSISSAAKRLYISQPAISIAIKELEAELGVSLFHRDKNRLYPTKEGTFIFDKTDIIIRQTESILEYVANAQNGKHVLTISVPPLLASSLLPVLLNSMHEFEKRNPSVTLHLCEAPSRLQVASDLFDGNLTMAIAYSFEGDCYKNHNKKVLYQVPLCLYINDQHPLASRKVVSAEDLTDVPLLTIYKENTAINQLIDLWFNSKNLHPNYNYRFSQKSLVTFLNENYNLAAIATSDLMPEAGPIKKIALKPMLMVDVALCWDAKHVTDSITLDAIRYISDRLKKQYISGVKKGAADN